MNILKYQFHREALKLSKIFTICATLTYGTPAHAEIEAVISNVTFDGSVAKIILTIKNNGNVHVDRIIGECGYLDAKRHPFDVSTFIERNVSAGATVYGDTAIVTSTKPVYVECRIISAR